MFTACVSVSRWAIPPWSSLLSRWRRTLIPWRTSLSSSTLTTLSLSWGTLSNWTCESVTPRHTDSSPYTLQLVFSSMFFFCLVYFMAVFYWCIVFVFALCTWCTYTILRVALDGSLVTCRYNTGFTTLYNAIPFERVQWGNCCCRIIWSKAQDQWGPSDLVCELTR